MYTGLYVKYPVFLLDIKETWNCSTYFRKKNIQLSNFIKIRPLEADLFHADGRTDK